MRKIKVLEHTIENMRSSMALFEEKLRILTNSINSSKILSDEKFRKDVYDHCFNNPN